MQADGLILAGGKSGRMNGIHKGNLMYRQESFVDRLVNEFKKEARNIWISYGNQVHKEYKGCKIVLDKYVGCGPIGGLHAGLQNSRNKIIMTAPCDMPLIEMKLYYFLEQFLKPQSFGVVPLTEGKMHPLAALYRKEAAKILEQQIQIGNYRVKDAVKRMPVYFVEVSQYPDIRKMLLNINTLAEYRMLTRGEEYE